MAEKAFAHYKTEEDWHGLFDAYADAMPHPNSEDYPGAQALVADIKEFVEAQTGEPMSKLVEHHLLVWRNMEVNRDFGDY